MQSPNTLQTRAAAAMLPSALPRRFATSAAISPARRSRWGRPRPELRLDLRSHPHRNYVIFFRYVGDALEIVHVLEGHRDVVAFFEDKR
jgi:plasmid stabilization system protein ParE